MQEIKPTNIKAIIGLGNPGSKYYKTRHSIGFRVLDEIARRYQLQWKQTDLMEFTDWLINNQRIILIKPITFMNDSGRVLPYLKNKGIKPENILVVHDELEKAFGKLAFKIGGSHRGHNGLRSIIQVIGPEFARLRFGISRPEDRQEVADYVLRPFHENENEVTELIDQSADMIEDLFKESI